MSSGLDKLISAYEECIRRNEEIVQKMEKIVEEVESFKSKCMAAKTVGTALEVVGAAGVALAPFTGGTTLVVTVGVGLAAGIGTNLVTDLINSSETKEFLEELADYNSSREAKLAHLAKLLDSLASLIQKEVGNGKAVDDASFYKGIYKMDGGRTGWFYKLKFKRSVKKLEKQELDHDGSSEGSGGEIGVVEGLAIATVAYIFLKNVAWIAASQGGAKSSLLGIQAALEFLGTSVTAGAALQGLAVIGAAVFITIEISRLVSEWTSEHPACTYARDLIQNIKEQTDSFKQMVQIIIRSRETLRSKTSYGLLTKTKVTKTKERTRRESESSSDDECTCVQIKIPVLYLNTQSMRPVNDRRKMEKIKKFKDLVAAKKPEIVAFVETWLEPEDTADLQCKWGLEGYRIHRVDRKAAEGVPDSQQPGRGKSTGRKGGGILVAWKEGSASGLSVRHDPTSGLNQHDNLQSYILERDYGCQKCNPTKSKKSVSFRVIYRRPGRFHQTREHSSEDNEEFKAQNENLLEKLFDFFKDGGGFGDFEGSVVVGDFNLKRGKLDRRVERTENGVKLYPEVWNLDIGPTRFLDRIRTSKPDAILATPSTLVTSPVGVTSGISDHAALDFYINFGKDYGSSGSCDACD